MADYNVVLERSRREAMEMHAVDVDDECSFFECLLDIAVFPNAVPDFVRPGFLVEDAAVF